MIYDLTEIRRLLLYSYSDLEQLRRTAHKDPVVRCALRIKQYMTRHGIATVREGMRRFAADRSPASPPARKPRAPRSSGPAGSPSAPARPSGIAQAMDSLFVLD